MINSSSLETSFSLV